MKAFEQSLSFSRASGHALVVETERSWRFLCWQRAQYAPCWDLGDAWVTAEWLETMGTHSRGYNFEPIHDKQCRHSRVQLESRGDARCVVHWDYGVTNVRGEMFHGNTTAEETYCIYPPGYAVRELIAHPGDQHTRDGRPTFWEVSEMVFVTPRGMTPFDYIAEHAASYMSLDGDRYEQMWARDSWEPAWRMPSTTLCREHPSSKTWQEVIVRAHLRNRPDPFVAFATSQAMFPHSICPWCNESNIPVRLWPPYTIWPHWPIYEGTDFRVARPGGLEDCQAGATHTSIYSAGAWYMHPAGRIDPQVSAPWWYPQPGSRWLFLTGVTDRDDEYLLDLTRSWLHPAAVTVEGGTFAGYDPAQMVYRILAGRPRLEIRMHAEHPILNPVFALVGWEKERAAVSLNGQPLDAAAYRLSREDATMILFIERRVGPECQIAVAC